jgi:hypothetical protein
MKKQRTKAQKLAKLQKHRKIRKIKSSILIKYRENELLDAKGNRIKDKHVARRMAKLEMLKQI